MLGTNHIEHILHCLRAKAARDLKPSPAYAADAARRLAINNECQLLMRIMLETPDADAITVAKALGWIPPLVSTAPLTIVAGQWLDARA